MRSMTGFGRSSRETFFGHLTVEVNSINRKFLDLNIQLPKEWNRFESEMRKILSTTNKRGLINLKVEAFFENESPFIVIPNLPLARQIKTAWETLAHDLFPKSSVDLSLLNTQENILLYETNDENEGLIREVLLETVNAALEQLNSMKETEGNALREDIEKRFQKIQSHVESISERSVHATERYRQKLMDRINDLFPGKEVENEQRILLEIALFAEKVDISEEITRLGSHLNQARNLLNAFEAIGKTLEFILQEMNREINTIGSKTADVEVTKRVIDCKSELEKIREQIQNIE